MFYEYRHSQESALMSCKFQNTEKHNFDDLEQSYIRSNKRQKRINEIGHQNFPDTLF